MSADCVTENRCREADANQVSTEHWSVQLLRPGQISCGGTQTGLIHIEYAFAPTGTLEYVKVWSSIARGHWLLACEYWISANTFHGTGVRFDHGYESEGLAHIFEFVMQRQNSFALPLNLGRQGLLQISTPIVEESAAAGARINEVCGPLTSTFAKPTVA
jgi:hypothetical protein